MNLAILLAEVVALVIVSGMCSGLNIALMSLNPTRLKRRARLGNHDAAKVLPLRQKAHLSLASILFFNIAVVTATSLVLEQAFNGIIAEIVSTFLIVIFGEILPQALFVHRALWFCAKLAPVLRLMIVLSYFLSKPMQLLLNRLIGKELAHLPSRHELGLIISEHLGRQDSELDEDEVEIMRGALSLSEKRVRDIMVDIAHVYWLTPETHLNDATLDAIKQNGFSRIPVFNRKLTVPYGVLLMKDLFDMDNTGEPPEAKDLTLYPTPAVGQMTALDTLFRKFIGGSVHLLPVEHDDKIVGIVTIEDLIEEILQHEIVDETDRQKLRQPA
jgi:CBS domain containing-hemolysin-like protein